MPGHMMPGSGHMRAEAHLLEFPLHGKGKKMVNQRFSFDIMGRSGEEWYSAAIMI